MKKLLITAAAAAGLLGAGLFFFSPVPATATECPGGTAMVTTNPTGSTVACVDTETGIFDGGSVVNGGCYVVLDGDPDNNVTTTGDDPFSGYVGVSSCSETTDDGDPAPAADGTCDDDDPSSINSGGCYGVKGVATVDIDNTVPAADNLPQPVCGDDTGGVGASSRDGCRVP